MQNYLLNQPNVTAFPAFDYHLYAQTITWTLIVNVGILAMLCRHTHAAYYIHAGAMSFAVFFSFTAMTIKIISSAGSLGDAAASFHPIVGNIVFTLLIVIYLLGFWMKYTQSSSNVKAWVI